MNYYITGNRQLITDNNQIYLCLGLNIEGLYKYISALPELFIYLK